MQFNGDTDDQDIVSHVVDATGQNKTADIKQITRACNVANREIWARIFKA